MIIPQFATQYPFILFRYDRHISDNVKQEIPFLLTPGPPLS